MPIVINLAVMMAKRRMSLTELSENVGLTLVNMSLLKSGKVRGIRLNTLDAICETLNCQPGDILEYLDKKTYKKQFPDGPSGKRNGG